MAWAHVHQAGKYEFTECAPDEMNSPELRKVATALHAARGIPKGILMCPEGFLCQTCVEGAPKLRSGNFQPQGTHYSTYSTNKSIAKSYKRHVDSAHHAACVVEEARQKDSAEKATATQVL